MITGEIKTRIDGIWNAFGIKVKVEYNAPEVVLGCLETLQNEINAAIAEFKSKFLQV